MPKPPTAPLKRLFGFPDPVNDKAARVVATGVVVLTALFLATSWVPLLVVLVYGFWARLLTGPRLSPLGRLATSVVAPQLGSPKYVPGPPKRLAQGIGAAFTTIALVSWLAGNTTVATVFLAMLLGAATLEAALGLCLGCKFYALLVHAGLIDEHLCVECADLTTRPVAVKAR